MQCLAESLVVLPDLLEVFVTAEHLSAKDVLSSVLRAVWWKEALHRNDRCLGQDLQGGGWKGLLQGPFSPQPCPSAWQRCRHVPCCLIAPLTLQAAHYEATLLAPLTMQDYLGAVACLNVCPGFFPVAVCAATLIN